MTAFKLDLTDYAWLPVVIFKMIIHDALLKSIEAFADMEQGRHQHIGNH